MAARVMLLIADRGGVRRPVIRCWLSLVPFEIGSGR